MLWVMFEDLGLGTSVLELGTISPWRQLHLARISYGED